MIVWIFFGVSLIWSWNENWPFSVIRVIQICWHIAETLRVSSFRNWNSSAGIPLPPLALFVVILPRANWLHILGNLTLSEWSHHSCNVGLEDLFCIVLQCILAISSTSIGSLLFLSYIVTIFTWNVPLVSLIFLKSSLIFPIQLFSFISLHYLLKKTFLSLLAILWNSAFSWYIFPFLPCLSLHFFSQLFVRPLHFAFLHFFFLGLILVITFCTMLWTPVRSSSGTLSDQSFESICFLHCIIVRDLV